MDDVLFEMIRRKFRHTMAEKSAAEIRAIRKALSEVMKMNHIQVLALLSDLDLLESYKNKVHSTAEEWERIEDSFYKS